MKSLLKPLIRKALNKLGYDIFKKTISEEQESLFLAKSQAYIERDEYGASNLEQKLERIKVGLPFEFPNIINLNRAVTLFLEDEVNILELGSGTGKFAVMAATGNKRKVVASEFDKDTYEWCLENIPNKENIVFINEPPPSDLKSFDVVVSIEVVEHISNYPGFLRECAELAPRVLLTTPNRKRSKEDYHAGPPAYFQHVREWTAGEFYWVLRCFWDDVRLYALTSQSEPDYIQVDVDTTLSPLIADCRSPIKMDKLD